MNVISDLSEADVQKQLIALSLGKGEFFRADWPHKARQVLHSWLQRQSGDYCPSGEPIVDYPQPFYLELIGGLLREAQDADYNIYSQFRTGVTAGILEPLPRTPAVFEEQKKWRLNDDPFEIAVDVANNYASLNDHVEEVRRQFTEDVNQAGQDDPPHQGLLRTGFSQKPRCSGTGSTSGKGQSSRAHRRHSPGES